MIKFAISFLAFIFPTLVKEMDERLLISLNEVCSINIKDRWCDDLGATDVNCIL